jgi:hypothetical protein
MYTANLATGKVAIYNKSLAMLSLTFIPIIYIAIRITHWPEIVFILNVLRNIIGVIIRLFILRKQMRIGIREYMNMVVFRIGGVALFSSFISIIVYEGIGTSTFATFSIILIISILSVLLSVYYWGLNKDERLFILAKGRALLFSFSNVK